MGGPTGETPDRLLVPSPLRTLASTRPRFESSMENRRATELIKGLENELVSSPGAADLNCSVVRVSRVVSGSPGARAAQGSADHRPPPCSADTERWGCRPEATQRVTPARAGSAGLEVLLSKICRSKVLSDRTWRRLGSCLNRTDRSRGMASRFIEGSSWEQRKHVVVGSQESSRGQSAERVCSAELRGSPCGLACLLSGFCPVTLGGPRPAPEACWTPSPLCV